MTAETTAKEPDAPSSLRKKYTSREKREYVLRNLGLKTRESMAKYLDCTETAVYNIIKKIRDERDNLINPELIGEIAEQQYNRLNSSVQIRFQDYINEQRRVQDIRNKNMGCAMTKQPPIEYNTDDLKEYFYMYGTSERQLTNFLKAIGHYNPDINLIDASRHQTMVVNIEAANALDEVNAEYGAEQAKITEERIRGARLRNDDAVIDVKATDIKPKKKTKNKGGK